MAFGWRDSGIAAGFDIDEGLSLRFRTQQQGTFHPPRYSFA